MYMADHDNNILLAINSVRGHQFHSGLACNVVIQPSRNLFSQATVQTTMEDTVSTNMPGMLLENGIVNNNNTSFYIVGQMTNTCNESGEFMNSLVGQDIVLATSEQTENIHPKN